MAVNGILPKHRIYVEPYGGGGSVLLRKSRSYGEIYNDLDGEIVNLFRVARDHGEELAIAVELTPFAREEFANSYVPDGNPIEQARRTLVRSFMGFGSASVSKQISGFRANSNRSGTTPAHDWMNYADSLRSTIHRLRGVVIENRNALEVMGQHDGTEVLHYVDPPYVHETRYLKNKTHCYRFEMTDSDHETLADHLHQMKGAVALSGYICPLYLHLYRDWHLVKCKSFADGARPRVEALWLSKPMDKGLFG